MSERMQSLLSRAVEDQITEQRQLAGVLGEIRAVLGRLDERLEDLRQAAGGTAAEQVEQATGAVAADVREAVRVLAERLDGVGRLVGQRGQDLVEIRTAVGQVRESVDAQAAAVGAVAGGLGALPAFGERSEALQGGLGGLHDRLGGLEQLVVGVESLQQRADATEAAVRELRHAFTGVAARIAELPPRADVEALVNRPVEALDTLGSRLGRLEGSLPGLLERLDAIDAAAATHGDRVDEVLARLGDGGGADTDPGGRESTAVALADLRTDLARRLDDLGVRETDPDGLQRLAEQVAELREALVGDGGLADRLDAAPDPADTEQPGAVAAAVEEAVARAVADTEQRLTAHIDDAVLALAEALLKRRSARDGARADILAAATPAVRAAPEEPDEAAYDENGDDQDGDGDAEIGDDEDVSTESEAALDDVGDDAGDEPVDDDGYTPAWQTPTGWAAETAQSPEPPRKRKPWWRPGD
jgi:hypothetical protein